MSENLEWQKRSSEKNKLAENLEELVNGVIVSELNEINSKLESLCSMGILKEGPELEALRLKMEQLQAGNQNVNL